MRNNVVGLFMAVSQPTSTHLSSDRSASRGDAWAQGQPLEWRAYLLRGLTIIYSVAALIMLAIWYLLLLFGRHPVCSTVHGPLVLALLLASLSRSGRVCILTCARIPPSDERLRS